MLTLRLAKIAGCAGGGAGVAAAALAALQLSGATARAGLDAGQLSALSMLLVAGAVTLLGAACLQVLMRQARGQELRAVRTAFTAGVDYGAGRRRAAVNLTDIFEDAA